MNPVVHLELHTGDLPQARDLHAELCGRRPHRTTSTRAGWGCCFSAKEQSLCTGSSVRSLLRWTNLSSGRHATPAEEPLLL
jgi:hypothetical protein